jgi:hypothetical protein
MEGTMTTGTAIRLAILLVLLLTLIGVAPVHQPTQHAHGADPNDHTAMYAGGVPGTDEPLPLKEAVICEDVTDEQTGITSAVCVEAAGLGTGAPNRSYTSEQPGPMGIYVTNDGDPDPTSPSFGDAVCHPQNKDTHEIGIMWFYDPVVYQGHAYGPPVASGPRGPPATDGCVRWHAQADANFIGRSVNMVGIDGTGRRAQVAEMHHIVYEVPNPCYGKPCAGPFVGRYLHWEGRQFVFEIAASASQNQEVWYTKHIGTGATADDRMLYRHQFGQFRIPFLATWYTMTTGTQAGKPSLGIVSPSDGAFIWNTCGTTSQPRYPGEEGLPCVKSTIDAARGTLRGRSYQNPNVTSIPQDRFGNRLVPPSYHWVRCLDDQADLPMPNVRDGDGNWLNPHQWNVSAKPRVLPYQPPHCAYSINQDAALYWPVDGMRGVPNGPPAPEPTGEPAETPGPDVTPFPTFPPTETATPAPPTDTPIPTSTPEPEATATPTATVVPTATQAPPEWREVMPIDAVHWWASDVYHVEAKPAPDFIDQLTAGVDWAYGDSAPRDGLPADNWTAVYYGTWQGAIQAVRVRCDDDCRVVIDDVVVWDGVAYSTREIPVTHLDAAPVPVRVEHRDTGGNAYVRVEFIRPGGPPATVTATPTEEADRG